MKLLGNYHYRDVHQFSKRDQDFVDPESKIHGLLPYPNDDRAFLQSIKGRAKTQVDRSLLVEVLRDQYQSFQSTAQVDKQIESLLDSNTFTITTAHQPVIFLGPMYVIYKALSAIKLANDLKKQYPEYHFVPMFIVGGEDHDFEEISTIEVFGKKFSWIYDAKGQSVGSLPSQELKDLSEALSSLFERDPKGMKLLNRMEASYLNASTLTQATQDILHQLMGALGLVTLDMSDKRLKRSFIPHIRKEILLSTSQTLVQQDQDRIQSLGFKPQAHAREVNFFYLSSKGRKRILLEGDQYRISDFEATYSKSEMEAMISDQPERFSPNVVMRPVYQSHVLPDIAYVGGGGELAYWTERVSQFEAFEVHYPVLVRRASIALMNTSAIKNWEKLGFDTKDLLSETQVISKRFLKAQLPVDLTDEQNEFIPIFKRLSDKVNTVDASLEKKLMGIERTLQKELEGLNKKLIRSMEGKNENSLKKIEKIKDQIHSDRALQERRDNILNFYSRSSKDFISELYRLIEVQPARFQILTLD